MRHSEYERGRYTGRNSGKYIKCEIGYFTSVRYTAQGVIGLGLLKVFQKLIRGEILAILSALINAGTFVYEALARTDLVIFLGM